MSIKIDERNTRAMLMGGTYLHHAKVIAVANEEHTGLIYYDADSLELIAEEEFQGRALDYYTTSTASLRNYYEKGEY